MRVAGDPRRGRGNHEVENVSAVGLIVEVENEGAVAECVDADDTRGDGRIVLVGPRRPERVAHNRNGGGVYRLAHIVLECVGLCGLDIVAGGITVMPLTRNLPVVDGVGRLDSPEDVSEHKATVAADRSREHGGDGLRGTQVGAGNANALPHQLIASRRADGRRGSRVGCAAALLVIEASEVAVAVKGPTLDHIGRARVGGVEQ